VYLRRDATRRLVKCLQKCVNYARGRRISHLKLTAQKVTPKQEENTERRKVWMAEGEIYAPKLISCKNN